LGARKRRWNGWVKNKLKGTKMINWIKDNFGLKNVLILVLVVFVIVGLIEGPSWYKFIVGNRYDGVTQARVTNVVPKKSTFQQINGISTKTIGYDIMYVYTVKNVNYSTMEFVKPDADVNLIFEQFNAGKPCTVGIRYSIKTPSRSSISKLNLSN
jgi:hypothetical protein